ncbi:phosphoglycolate phosphatase [Brevundimonas vesicularis]|uniref:Phosphoglycolate phosphatase n=1 Tax=Brevundimonas vesicularis TaxID=41276 RepID=A0A1Z3UDJ3_BREVE|nr:HAD-IA family hydrolase [Brevundimonas vesicularis]ASE41260.1 phosphoglycolate phosphatase [Brevundimonas vesicularis]MDQ1192560.1 phosphoglycolate phosphatase [Brevundimonas vesicularis]MDX2334424.1 HAD-IA family hydrolase [Brevundimonas vesicularis]
MSDRDLEGWTIAFDLDGTLVDSAPDLIGTLNRMLVEEGLPPVPMESASTLIGSGARALLVHGFEAAGAPVERAKSDELFERFLVDYAAHIADGSQPFEGVVETLERLSERGAILVVATNKRSDLSELLLGKLDLTRHFAAIVGPDRVSARKPSGAHLKEAVVIAGGDPERAIMVGDAAPDADAAKDAGMPCILTTFGFTPTPVEDLGGDVLIDAFEDVEEAIDGILSDFYVRRALKF